MREHKFKYYWQHNETGEIRIKIVTLDDIQGSVRASELGIPDYSNHWDVIDRCEFTGLFDKNGAEIYEGDIFTEALKENWIVYWEFRAARFRAMWTKNNLVKQGLEQFQKIEVIGNIYEHKHLLEESK